MEIRQKLPVTKAFQSIKTDNQVFTSFFPVKTPNRQFNFSSIDLVGVTKLNNSIGLPTK